MLFFPFLHISVTYHTHSLLPLTPLCSCQMCRSYQCFPKTYQPFALVSSLVTQVSEQGFTYWPNVPPIGRVSSSSHRHQYFQSSYSPFIRAQRWVQPPALDLFCTLFCNTGSFIHRAAPSGNHMDWHKNAAAAAAPSPLPTHTYCTMLRSTLKRERVERCRPEPLISIPHGLFTWAFPKKGKAREPSPSQAHHNLHGGPGYRWRSPGTLDSYWFWPFHLGTFGSSLCFCLRCYFYILFSRAEEERAEAGDLRLQCLHSCSPNSKWPWLECVWHTVALYCPQAGSQHEVWSRKLWE